MSDVYLISGFVMEEHIVRVREHNDDLTLIVIEVFDFMFEELGCMVTSVDATDQEIRAIALTEIRACWAKH